MRTRLLTSAAIALSLIATPALANPAARLSVANSPQIRASSHVDDENRLAPGAWAAIVGALAIGAGAIILAVDDDDDDEPASA